MIVTDGPNENLVRSAGNVGKLRTLPVQVLNTLELLNKKQLIIKFYAVIMIEETWGGIYKGESSSDVPSDGQVEEVTEAIVTEAIVEEKDSNGVDHSLVENLGLSNRTKNILLQAGIIGITDLTNLSKVELMDIQSFGKKSYEEVCQQLESMELLPSDWD